MMHGCSPWLHHRSERNAQIVAVVRNQAEQTAGFPPLFPMHARCRPGHARIGSIVMVRPDTRLHGARPSERQDLAAPQDAYTPHRHDSCLC